MLFNTEVARLGMAATQFDPLFSKKITPGIPDRFFII
jgi:hypothetical protein